jgi:hypothetical protein
MEMEIYELTTQELIVWSLLAYGITNIGVYGKIFNSPRTWLTQRSSFFRGLLGCMMCLGMWVGMFLSVTLYSPTSLIYDMDTIMFRTIEMGNFTDYLCIVFDGFLSSGIVWLIHTIQEWFERGNQLPSEE